MSWLLVSLSEAVRPDELSLIYSDIFAAASIDKSDALATVRLFERLRGLAVNTDVNRKEALQGVPGVELVVWGGQTANSEDGSWYVRLASAWEWLLSEATGRSAGIATMSLAPPSRFTVPTNQNELVQRAFRHAWKLGILPVVAAGNWGEWGEDTMSSWAQSPFCVSVGAADVAGQGVKPYSSRGLAGSNLHPTLVAPEQQIPPTGEVGTSFAAPIVSDVALLFQAFLFVLWKRTGRDEQEFKHIVCPSVIALIKASAKPIAGEEFEKGAGFLNLESAIEWLQQLTGETLLTHVPVLGSVDGGLLTETQRLAKTMQPVVEEASLTLFTIDEDFEWVEPIFVPGLLRISGNLLFRQIAELHEVGEIDWAFNPVGNSRYIQITMYPWRLRGRMRRVGTGVDEYESVSIAIRESNPGDVVFLPRGVYEGPVELRSKLMLLGEQGSVITSKSGAAVIADGIDNAAIRNLTLEVAGSRTPALNLSRSNGIGFRNCLIRSQEGNGVSAIMCRRLSFDGCQISGGINGAFLGLSQEIRLQSCAVEGKHTGLMFNGSSGWGENTMVNGGMFGVLYFGFDYPWFVGPEVTLFVYPFMKFVFRTADVRIRAIASSAPGAWLAKQLFGLQFDNSTIVGGEAGVVANDFQFVGLENASTSGTWSDFAKIDAELTDEMRIGKTPLELLSLVRRLISTAKLVSISEPTRPLGSLWHNRSPKRGPWEAMASAFARWLESER